MVPHFARDDVRCNCAYVFSESQVGMGSICTIDHGDENEPLEIAKANARLIAAAPELLAMLTKVVNCGSWYYSALEIDINEVLNPGGEELEQEIRALITKATTGAIP